MSFARSVKRKLKASVAPTLFLSLVAYFLWNATQGDRGLQAYARSQRELAAAQAELVATNADLEHWEHRVAGLRGDHLDLDTLDERARAMLNLASPNDIVVPYPPGQRLF